MGKIINQSVLHGVVIPNNQITPDAITAKDDTTVLLQSKYSQEGPFAGLAQPGGDYQMAIHPTGVAEEDASIEIVTQAGGHPIPEDGGYVWRNLADGNKDDEYKGADSFVSFNDWLEINYNTAGNTPQLNVIRLQNGDLLAAGIETAANTAKVATYTTSAGTWGSLVDPVVTENSTTQYALCQLPTGRVLLYWISSNRTQINARYSDDNGATWNDYAFSVLGTQIKDSTGALVTARRMQVGYSNGQMLLLLSFIDSGHGGTQNMMQYASIDEGHNFELVDADFYLVTGDFPADNPNIVSIPSGGFAVVCHTRDVAEVVTEYKVQAYRLGNAYTPINQADVTALTDFFGTALAIGYVLALTAWIDEDDIMYALNQDAKFKGDAGLNTEYRLQLYRSLDFGATWSAYNGACSNWGVLTNNLHSFDCASTGGKAMLCSRWTSVVDTAGYAEHSTAAVGLGGFGTHTLPDTNFDTSQHYQEVNALSWAPATQTAPTDNFGEVWLPIELPYNSMGWTRTGGSTGTQAITSNAEMSIVTEPGQAESNQISHASATILHNMVQFSVRIPAGNGDKTTDEISVRVQLSDNATYGYDVTIRMDDTGYEVYDREAASNVFTAAPPLTSRRWFRIAMAKGQVRVWTSPDGHFKTYAEDGNGVITDNGGASGYTNVVKWGHQAAVANTSYWSFVGYNVNPDTWTASYRLFAGGWNNPAALRAKSYSSRRTLIDDGIFVAAEGGPTTIGESWQVDADYDYPLSAIHPFTDPSPSRKWRTKDETEQLIVWDTEDLFDDSIQDNNLLYFGLLNANFKSAMFEGWNGVAWDTLATLDASDGYSPLEFVRYGRKVVPDKAKNTQGREWLFYQDHVDDTFDLGVAGGQEEDGVRYVRITKNREGSWVGVGAKTKLPVVTLDNDQLRGDEVANGTGHIWRKSFGAYIAGFQGLYDTYRLRIPAQDTADGYFELGQVVFGAVAVFGTQYDRGYTYAHLHPAEVTTLSDGTQRTRVDGPEQRRFTFALAEGAVDVSTVEEDDPSPDYRTAEAGRLLAVASPHDTTRTIEGIIRETHGPDVPVLLLTAIPRDTTAGATAKVTPENRRRTFVWGRIMTDPSVEAFRGTEGVCEKERYQIITIEETI